jgi:hypothetical protein
VAKFKYFETTVTNQNLIQEEIEFGQSIHKLLPSHLLSKNLQKYNFACGSVWVRNFISDIKGGTKTEDVGNRVLRRISEPKRDEVIGGWRKVHNEELHNL